MHSPAFYLMDRKSLFTSFNKTKTMKDMKFSLLVSIAALSLAFVVSGPKMNNSWPSISETDSTKYSLETSNAPMKQRARGLTAVQGHRGLDKMPSRDSRSRYSAERCMHAHQAPACQVITTCFRTGHNEYTAWAGLH